MKSGFSWFFLGYIRLLIFAIGVLLGIQIPSFIDQYQKRVDAHFREVSANIIGFQRTADLLFEGDLRQLINYYANSDDQVFQRDADSVQIIVDRYQRIAAEQQAMGANLLAVSLHVLFAADREIFAEAMTQYSYTVPLNVLSVQWGLALAIVLMLTIDGLLFGCGKCINLVKNRGRRTMSLD